MTQYFVDPAGSDAAAGTSPAVAWQTLTHAGAASYSAGDSLLLKRGGKWRETLTFPSSGSNGSPITIGAYGTGADPIISAADVLSTTGWTLHTDTLATFLSDNFTRADSSGWGSAATGTDTDKSWDGGTVNFAISSNRGALTKDFGGMLTGVGDERSDDVDVFAEFSSVPATSDNGGDGVHFRVSASSGYAASYERSTGTVYLLDAYHGGAITTAPLADLGAAFKLRAWCQTVSGGNVRIRIRAWASAGSEPSTWSIDYLDSTLKYPSGSYSIAAYNTTGVSDSFARQFTVQSIVGTFASTYQKTLATDPGYVVIEDGALLTHVTSVALVEATPASFYWISNVLYVHATGGGSPASNGRVYEAATRAYCIDISAKSWVTVGAIVCEATTFNGNNAGIHIQNGSHDVIVDGATARFNNVWGIFAGAEGGTTPTNITFRNCLAYQNQGYGGIGGAANTLFLVEDCVSYGNGNPQDTGTSGPWHDHGFYLSSNAGVVRRCVSYGNLYGSGFSSGQGSTSITWSYNKSYGNQFDFFLHEGTAGDALYQFTGYASDVGLQIGVDSGIVTSPLAVKNCILSASATAGVRVGSGGSGVGAAFSSNDVHSLGADYSGVSSQTGVSGNFSSDPLFQDALSFDLTLSAASPCLDAGVVIAGIGQVFSGSAPDLGYVERPADQPGGGGYGHAMPESHFKRYRPAYAGRG